jgi:hypothetical protein
MASLRWRAWDGEPFGEETDEVAEQILPLAAG